MRGTCTAVVAAIGLLCACSSEGSSLTIDLRTDYLPGTEFSRVETTVEVNGDARDAIPSGASATDDFVDGQRIAEYSGLAAGDAQIRVTLRSPSGDLLATRLTRLRLDGDRGVLVVVSRSCGGVRCPGPSDAPDATECLSGQCVPPACSSETPAACGAVSCEAGVTCSSAVACVEPVCEGLACLLVSRDARCAAGERCDPERGCVAAAVDAGLDGGPGDGGTLDPSLVAYWPCERLEDLILEDATGNGHDGSCSRALCPAILPGRVGMACEFVREFPDSIVVPHHPDLNAESGFTIALWMQARAADGLSALSKPLGTGGRSSYKVALFDFSGPTLGFVTSPDGMTVDLMSYAGSALTAEWHHVAATWDGTTKRLYLDGVQVGTDTPGTTLFDDNDLCLGCDAEATIRSEYFDGLLDEIRFYDRALGIDEIAALASTP